MRRGYFFLFILGLLGCNGRLGSGVSRFLKLTGNGFLKGPTIVSAKDLHLNWGQGAAGEVVLSGDLRWLDKQFTYMVIEDRTGRVLVLLSQMAVLEGELEVGDVVQVVGDVSSGGWGHKLVTAKQLKKLE